MRLLPLGVFLLLVSCALAPFSGQLLAIAMPTGDDRGRGIGTAGVMPTGPMTEPQLLPAPPPAATGPWLALGANHPAPGGATEPEPGIDPPAWVAIGTPCATDDAYISPHCHIVGTASGEAPERSIYVLGNSHTVQLGAALLEAVDRHGEWSMRSQAAPGCPFEFVEEPDGPCQEMWRTGTRYILEQQPDLVVIMATRSSADGPDEENLLPGLIEWVEMITSATTTRVVVVRDSPRFDFDMHRCAVQRGPSSPECAVDDPTLQLPGHRLSLETAGAAYIDLNGAICPDGVCRPVVGGVWTYMDDNHIGADFWRTLARPLSAQLNARLQWWPADPYLGEPLPRPTSGADPVL